MVKKPVQQVGDTDQLLLGSNTGSLGKQPGMVDNQRFLDDNLRTDTSLHSIELHRVLDGGPGKDGIPAIDTPTFFSVPEAANRAYVDDQTKGVVVSSGEIARFFPYSILTWHEIVNDELNGKPIAVTFCPLCGSAIVFDRTVNGEPVRFGVSGKLYNSNLLMYDHRTESLWSQAMGEGVVGDYTDVELNRVDSDVMSFSQFRENYSSGRVLSDETGYNRPYTKSPYGGYKNTERLYFPVTNTDPTLPKKTLLSVVNDEHRSVAFVKEELIDAKRARLEVGDTVYQATRDNGRVSVTADGKELPGYHEMWFSWVTHTAEKNIWTGG